MEHISPFKVFFSFCEGGDVMVTKLKKVDLKTGKKLRILIFYTCRDIQ